MYVYLHIFCFSNSTLLLIVSVCALHCHLVTGLNLRQTSSSCKDVIALSNGIDACSSTADATIASTPSRIVPFSRRLFIILSVAISSTPTARSRDVLTRTQKMARERALLLLCVVMLVGSPALAFQILSPASVYTSRSSKLTMSTQKVLRENVRQNQLQQPC